jgi:hypothetical protein
MSCICIDPEELAEMALLLQAASEQARAMAGALAGCCCCEMPAGTAAYAASELGGVRSELVALSGEYALVANDLGVRSDVANTDNLSSATAAAWGTGAVATTGALVLNPDPDLQIIVPPLPAPQPLGQSTIGGGEGINYMQGVTISVPAGYTMAPSTGGYDPGINYMQGVTITLPPGYDGNLAPTLGKELTDGRVIPDPSDFPGAVKPWPIGVGAGASAGTGMNPNFNVLTQATRAGAFDPAAGHRGGLAGTQATS